MPRRRPLRRWRRPCRSGPRPPAAASVAYDAPARRTGTRGPSRPAAAWCRLRRPRGRRTARTCPGSAPRPRGIPQRTVAGRCCARTATSSSRTTGRRTVAGTAVSPACRGRPTRRAPRRARGSAPSVTRTPIRRCPRMRRHRRGAARRRPPPRPPRRGSGPGTARSPRRRRRRPAHAGQPPCRARRSSRRTRRTMRGTPWSAPPAGCGAPRSGDPCSTMRPPSTNTTWSATSRANVISWVTSTMVIPSAARSRITRRTSVVASGSSDDVGSSNSSTVGSRASARAIATRCCSPPDI